MCRCCSKPGCPRETKAERKISVMLGAEDLSGVCREGWAGTPGRHTLSPAACPPGHWGDNCAQPCQCPHGETCHPQDGSCFCPPGWTGHLCLEGTNRRGALVPKAALTQRGDCSVWQLLIPAYLLGCLPACSPGMFGANCSQPCQCGFGERCHPETGACVCPPGHSGAPCRIGEISSRPLISPGNQDTGTCLGLCQYLGPSSRSLSHACPPSSSAQPRRCPE